MWSHKLIPCALLAYTFGSQAAVLQPRDISCIDVKISNLRDAAEAREIWDASIAGVIGDEFIANNGHEHWVQDMDQSIFGHKGDISDSWNCYDWGTRCNLENECADYLSSDGRSGAYFLFYSLQQFRSFTKSFHDRLQDNAIKETLDIWQVQDDFERHPDEDVNVWVLLASALGIVGGGFAAVPAVAGTMSVLAGASVAVGNANPSNEKVEDGGAVLAERVQASFEQMRTYLIDINGAVFGEPGYGQDLIPAELQKQSFANPAINALGEGQWLTADPTKGLNKLMDDMYFRMKQSLAWAMMRVARQSFVFIDKPVTESECGHNYNAAVWDPEHEWCFRLFHINDDMPHPVPDKVADKLWEVPYSLDKLEVYRNAYDCWVDNDYSIGMPVYTDDLGEGSVPKCFFGMRVTMGTYLKNGFAANVIEMSDDLGQDPGMPFDNKW